MADALSGGGMEDGGFLERAVPRARRSPPSVVGLTRPRLLTVLDEVLQTRLGLVVAPPGAGKTTLMSQWATSVGVDVAWLRVDAEDSTPRRLVDRLFQALRDHLDERMGTPTTMDELAVALEHRAEPLLLVVDDVHTIAGTAAEVDLERLLLVGPPSLRVLLGSRRRPSINRARLELPQAVLVTGSDLAFRAWEVERLFRVVYAAPLTDDDATALARRTAGWAAGLHLFHLSTSSLGPTERRCAVSGLSTRSRYAMDYLDSEVLAQLPRSLRRFLVRTAVLENLTPERCDALLGRGSGSRRALAELERLCPMVSSDDDGMSFTCHDVLRRHLATQLDEELGCAQARAWWCRAAEVLEGSGALDEALRARCRGADWVTVRRLLHVGGPRLVESGPAAWTEVLSGWLQEDDPWAALVVARRLLDDGQFVAASAAAERAEARFTDPVGVAHCRSLIDTAQAWGRWPVPETPGWTHLLRATSRRDPLAVVRRVSALEAPYRDLVHGVALAVAGDLVAARPILERCAHEPHEDATPALAARLALATLDGLLRPGTADAAAWDRVIAEADRRGLTWVARVAHGLSAAFGADDDGRLVASDVVAECERRGDPWGAALVEAALAASRVREGHVEIVPLERLTTRWRDLDAGVMEAWTRSLLALVAATSELPEALADAQSAESFARFAAVPGALSTAYAALAASRPEQRDELVALASSSAAATGMGHRPWRWVGRVDSALAGDVARAAGAAPEAVRAGEARRAAAGLRAATCLSGPVLDVRCFGEFRMLVDGDRLDLSVVRPRARSLLRLLAVHAGRVVHREELADALWGDLERTAAMHNLQVTLSSLRGVLAPGVAGASGRLIVREGNAYGLALPDGSTCDLLEFDRALARGRAGRAGACALDDAAHALRRAVDLYSGDLVPEEGPSDWAVRVREQYRLRAAEAGSALADLELARGNASAAAWAANRSVEIDPCRDAAWRTLIQAYRRSGDVAAGERAQRRYSDVLVDLGVDLGALEPVHVVVAARGEVVSHGRGTPPRPLPRARPLVPGTPHLS